MHKNLYKINTMPLNVLDAIFASSIDHIYIFDNTGTIIYASLGVETLLGLPTAEIIGKNHYEFGFPLQISNDFETDRKEVMKSGQTVKRQIAFPAPHGMDYYEYIVSPIYNDDNTCIEATLMIARDITKQKLTEEELQINLERYKLLFNSTNDGILVHRPPVHGKFPKFLEVNDMACRRLGYTREELLNLTIPDIAPQESEDDVAKIMEQFARNKHAIFQTILHTKDGRNIPAEVSSYLFELNGQPTILSINRDISDRKRLEEKVKYISEHDNLTDLFNRSFFEACLSKYRINNRLPKGVVICDLDKLKAVNDSLGHQVGDRLIAGAAAIIKKNAAPQDVVARIGGDEFAVIIHEHTNYSAEDLYNSIQTDLSAYNDQNPDMPINISIGYSTPISGHYDNIDDLIRQADDNMYREKSLHHQAAENSATEVFRRNFEARDFGSDGHLDRLQQIIGVFANKLGLGQSQITDLRLFAKFHDIGKAIMPDEIIFKPSQLSPAEWAEIRRHPEIGYRICKSLPDLVPFPDWILKHHEWWNGNGYPLGLKGEAIPFEARILSIVDAYDAMTSERPYRPAMSKAEAIAELKRSAGSQFDPTLVEKFIALLKENS